MVDSSGDPPIPSAGDPTLEDVELRYVVSRATDFSHELKTEDPLEILVESETQPRVTVSLDPTEAWCTCDEDVVPGTCSHVLYLATIDGPVGESIRGAIAQHIDATTEEIRDLTHELRARKMERDALEEAHRLTDPQSPNPSR